MPISVKDALHNQLEVVYNEQGYLRLCEKCWKLMELSESNAKFQKYRSVKGELAEIVLEYGLYEIQKVLNYPTVVLKSLCIPFRTGRNDTTEMDIVFITPYKIYMAECKSYKNCPKITGKCMLGESMDVYNQQRLHTIALNQYISTCIKKCEVRPYKCILFEMSLDGVDDCREDVYKRSMPVVNPNTLFNFMKNELKANQEKGIEIIDVKNTVKILTDLDNNSKKMFEKHLTRLQRKG